VDWRVFTEGRQQKRGSLWVPEWVCNGVDCRIGMCVWVGWYTMLPRIIQRRDGMENNESNNRSTETAVGYVAEDNPKARWNKTERK
jgi:hypothetical protein